MAIIKILLLVVTCPIAIVLQIATIIIQIILHFALVLPVITWLEAFESLREQQKEGRE
jgi:hypothetical protein